MEGEDLPVVESEQGEEQRQSANAVASAPQPEQKKKKVKQKTSGVWAHGTEDEKGFIVCNVVVKLGSGRTAPCGEKLVYVSVSEDGDVSKSTTGFKNHLARQHKIYLEAATKKNQSVQGRLDEGQWSTQSSTTRGVTEDLAKAIAIDKRPVAMVDGEGFRAWLNKYLPQYPVPAHVTIAAKIEEIGGGFVAFLKQTVALVPSYALTTDGWTSDAGHFYRCLTTHFFRPESLRLYSFVLALGLCGRTADDSAAFLVSALGRFNLDAKKCVAVTSDGCAVEVAALRLGQFTRVSCICHWLNLSLRTVFFAGAPASPGYPQGQSKSPVYDIVIAAHQNACTLANSPVIREEFVRRCEVLKASGSVTEFRVPPQGMVVRWGSYEACIRETVASKEVLGPLYRSYPTFTPLSDDQFAQLAQLDQILHPFNLLSSLMEGEKYVTIGYSFGELWRVCFSVFYSAIASDLGLASNVRSFKASLKERIGERLMANHSKCEISHAALLLHPFWKNLRVPISIPGHLSTDNILRFFKDITPRAKTMTLTLLEKYDLFNVPGAGGRAAAEPDAEDDVSIRLVEGALAAARSGMSASAEIDSWLSEPCPDPKEGRDPACAAIFWGSAISNRFPRLKELARRLLAVQASEAASERVFSIAGVLSDDERANTRPTTLGNRVLIAMNARKRKEWVNESIAEANARTGARDKPKGLLEVMDLVRAL